jgi:uncharacterized protein HemY
MIATVTHARVRASQGDVQGALRVLHGVLAVSPGDEEALRLRDELTGATPRLARRRAEALSGWIQRVRSRRRSRR